MSGFDRYSDDFRAEIRILRPDEGGRSTPPRNGIRWDFQYAEDDPREALYMIWPLFLDSAGEPMPSGADLPVDRWLPARMTVVNPDEALRTIHRQRIHGSVFFYCCEGLRHVAEGRVTRVTGLHSDAIKV
jgi:hypothetical protein